MQRNEAPIPEFPFKEATGRAKYWPMLLRLYASLPKEQHEAAIRHAFRDDFETPTCPSCDVKMVRRQKGTGFWGCRNSPRFRRTLAVNIRRLVVVAEKSHGGQMYNFLVAYGENAWKQGVYEFDRSRVFEYTEASIGERYKDLAPEVVEELKSIPTLFCVEGEESTSRVGYITDIKLRSGKVRIEFRFDSGVRPIGRGKIVDASVLFELGRFEITRTHWAIKDDDLWAVLTKMGVKTETAQRRAQIALRANEPAIATAPDPTKYQVFIVHGHDDVAKYEMAAELRRLGCEAVILHEQASGGMTVIEKIERYTNVGFAVALYTPCDMGGKRSEEMALSPRARQNVVFEHGYLIGKLGRKRVMAFVKGRVETPSDISGVVYIPLDERNAWKTALRTEMQAAEYLPR